MTAEDANVTPNQPKGEFKNPTWLKSLVMVMGVMIVALIGVIIYKVSTLLDEPIVSEPVAAAQTQPAEPYLSAIKAPEDATFVDVHGGGADAILRFKHDDGSWTLVMVDTRKGVERGRMVIR